MRKQHRTGGFVVGAVIGSSLGALTAFLFTTKKGHEIQRAVTDKYHEIEHAFEKSASRAVGRAASRVERSSKAVVKAASRIEKSATKAVKKAASKVKRTATKAKRTASEVKRTAKPRVKRAAATHHSTHKTG